MERSWRGKIEKDESPDKGALREVFEETGIKLEVFFSKGTVTWETTSGELDGIYVYLYEVDDDFNFGTPLKTPEGILEWKSIDWILNPHNLGIAEMVAQFLPVLSREEGSHSFDYKDSHTLIT